MRNQLALTNLYVSLIQRNAKTIDDVPGNLRGVVEEALHRAPPRKLQEWEIPEKETTAPEVNEEKPTISNDSDSVPFIGNRQSKVIHSSSCDSLPSDRNRFTFECFDSLQEAIDSGYRACQRCSPK